MTTMSFHKSAEWKKGLRTYYEYRDLGIVKATWERSASRPATAGTRNPMSNTKSWNSRTISRSLRSVCRLNSRLKKRNAEWSNPWEDLMAKYRQ